MTEGVSLIQKPRVHADSQGPKQVLNKRQTACWEAQAHRLVVSGIAFIIDKDFLLG